MRIEFHDQKHENHTEIEGTMYNVWFRMFVESVFVHFKPLFNIGIFVKEREDYSHHGKQFIRWRESDKKGIILIRGSMYLCYFLTFTFTVQALCFCCNLTTVPHAW